MLATASLLEKCAKASITISVDEGSLKAFGGDASGRRGAIPLAIVRPIDVAQVQLVVQIAGVENVSLVPVSSVGGPRRRGDTISKTPSVIVDLSGMQRILNIDGRNAIAIIEAGATFPQLAAALEPHGLRPYQPLMARASKSVLTTFLEREPMTVPGRHWDSSDPLAAMEAVFGTGDVFRTGGAALPGKLEDHLANGNRQMVGVGPAHTDFGRVLQGSQGALGIVTWASIYCQRIPTIEVPLFATADTLEPLTEFSYRLLRRRIDGQMFILNAVQLALILARDRGEFQTLRAELPPWILYFELTAPPIFPDEAIAYQRALVEDDAARLGLSIVPQNAGVQATAVASAQRTYPAESLLQRAGSAEAEVLFLSQLDKIPSHLEAIGDFASADRHAVYIQPMAQGVNAQCQFTFLAGPGGEAELNQIAQRAAACCADTGGFFSRPYYPWANVPFDRDPAIRSLLARAKNLLDPKHILQPDSLSLGEAA